MVRPFPLGVVIFGTMCLGFVIVGPEGTVGGPQWLGFLVMLLGFSVIFVAVKQHRDRDLGGVIKFGRAFLLGLGITMVASLLYTIGWETYRMAIDPAFIDKWFEAAIEAKKAESLPETELQEFVASMESMRELFAKPLFRLPMTFLEIFPFGLLVSLLSAAVLRKSEVLPATEAAPVQTT
ncbi:MAG: DUF4199 domain-containing protein [Acidobacteriota bacterium]